VLLQATAGRVRDSDLGRPEVGVRDQVDDGILGGLEAGVTAPPAAATTSLDCAVTRSDDLAAPQAAAAPLGQ
jgi:hypothetical protein